MKLPYSWIKELTGLKWSAEKMANAFTLSGIECAEIQSTAAYLDKVVVGKVEELHKVEGADKIRRAIVDIGKEKLQVICGAPNVAVGQKVPVATLGAKLAGGMEIKKAKIRGVESHGMICSESELGISQDHSGIMVLNGNSKIGTELVKVLDFNDFIMTFELTPNRGDAMSAIGVSRDLAALASVKINRPKFNIKPNKKRASSVIKVKINDPDACPRYAARIIENVSIAESPWWIKKKLLLSGVRPINNVVDITNLVMLECGHPLHAFDLDRFGSREVVVRRAKKGEAFTTLDGKEHKLTPDVLMITNGKTGVAAGGVMGGLTSEVEDDTKNILLEAAYFNPAVIRHSRKQLGMTSESQQRFEKGADPNGVEYAIDRAASLFQDICGGTVLNGIVDCYPKKIKPKKVTLRPERCNKLLGTKISPVRMKKILKDLEFKVSGAKNIVAEVPTFRSDIEREVDLIEEIARIDGIDKISVATENIGPLFTPLAFADKFKDELRTIMAGLGFDEIVGHGFVDSRLSKLIDPDLPLLKISNPVSAELDVMRNSMIPFALNVVSHNLSFRTMDLCLFEIGKTFNPPDKKGHWHEEYRFVALVTGQTETTWRDKPRLLDYYDLTGALKRLSEHFHWPELKYQSAKINCFEPDLSFDILLGESKVGRAGLLARNICDKIDIKQKVYLAELVLQPLIENSRSQMEFKPLPVYPAAPRDLAVVVDESVKAGEIVATVKGAAGTLAEKVEIFDLYQGKQIETGKKSLAVSIIYRSTEGSLSTEQVDKQQQIVVSQLKQKLNAEIRDK